MGTSHVAVRCRVTDLQQGTLVLPVYSAGTDSVEHRTSMSIDGEGDDISTLLELPAGSYRFDISVRPYDKEGRVIHGSCYETSRTADLVTGEVRTITLGD